MRLFSKHQHKSSSLFIGNLLKEMFFLMMRSHQRRVQVVRVLHNMKNNLIWSLFALRLSVYSSPIHIPFAFHNKVNYFVYQVLNPVNRKCFVFISISLQLFFNQTQNMREFEVLQYFKTLLLSLISRKCYCD